MNRQNIFGVGIGILMIGFGILFFIGQFLPGNAMRYLWPFFLIAIGALFFLGMVAGGKSTGGLAIPGTILTMLGLIFFIQAVFNIWATWAYAWTLLIVAVGIGLNIFGLWSDIPQLRFAGRTVMIVGGVLFFLFGIFFEAIFSLGGGRSMGGVLWAVLLILAGLFLLFGRERFQLRQGPTGQQVFNWSEMRERPQGSATGEVATGPASEPVVGAENTGAAWSEPAQGEIRGLVFRTFGDMAITQGDTEGLLIDASEAIRSRLRSRVQDGVLEIWYESNWWDWLDFGLWGGVSVHYQLNVRTLESIRMAGAGSIKADRLSTPRLEISHDGLGNLAIGVLETQDLAVRMAGLGSVEINGGRADRQVVDQHGAGSYRAPRLASRIARVSLSGLGSATVWASETLDAHVSGLGSIDYYGSPQVSRSVSGLGGINAHGVQ